jgi:hypothetical protein
MIELSTRKWATIKKTAQIVQPNVAKQAKLIAKIKELQEELEVVTSAIDDWDNAIKKMTGYSSAMLVKRVVEPTDKTDKDGRVLSITKWVPSELVTFDEEKNTYYVADNTIATPDECHEAVCDDTVAEEAPEVE